MKSREPTPHERRIAAMTTKERLIFRLIRRIAVLTGQGKRFDAECDRIALMTPEELHEDTKRKMTQIQNEFK